MALPVSPLAPKRLAHLPPLAGVRMHAVEAGIRYTNRRDLWLAVLPEGTTVAGVLTKSLTASAPVEWCRKALKRGHARAVIVNSGNSNAFTGKRGEATVHITAEAVAMALECRPEEIHVASTGVIGEPLDAAKIVHAMPELARGLSEDRWEDAARAIMTTDTFPKMATATAKLGGKTVRINGIAKGSGMIAPDMATMLAFLFTDAAIDAPVLQHLLKDAVEDSFNAITVDSDTSTSDTCLLFATGTAGNARLVNDDAMADFRQALGEVCRELALMIVADGEGAQKLVTIRVTGAASKAAAKKIGLSIANSPLVKTAVAGEDPNWGRIVAAVGKAGEKADRDRLRIEIGGHLVAEHGMVAATYEEPVTAKHMKGRDIRFDVDVGVGKHEATVWTCDLTEGYIKINADYRS